MQLHNAPETIPAEHSKESLVGLDNRCDSNAELILSSYFYQFTAATHQQV